MNTQILIIDSDTFALKKLREILSREGFNIMTVTNRESALNICEKIKIDYVIAIPEELKLNNQKKEE
ncbi:MAG: hypothetical protein AB1695_13600 [Stygiobacter sp.]|uniref:Response regulatory domain-containing protein n=1 Tax=Stygiobacter electus TaxID=3032292 RepID=A0AAE3P1N5_9BACT|nr:hypothetical protein [Stygiobacter electus]MDF1612605.1 hypothetical protein [Stygiobacter electus]